MKRSSLFFLGALLALVIAVSGCAGSASDRQEPDPGSGAEAVTSEEPSDGEAPLNGSGQESLPMSASSSGVVDGALDDRFGSHGEQFEGGYIPSRSMPISAENLPDGCSCLAIVMTDPDGSDWVHWLAADIPAAELLPENASDDGLAGIEGRNSFGTVGYGGPTPPSGTHTYVVTLYALSEPTGLGQGYSLEELKSAISGSVLGEAVFTCSYSH